LRVPDDLAGRKVRCPKCAGVADVPASDISALSRVEQPQPQPVMQSSTEAEEVRVRARRPAPIPEPEVEDAEEVEESPRPARSKSREAISARPLRQTPPPEADDEDQAEEASTPRPRRFKRRRRRRREKTVLGNWRWIRWAVAIVFYLLVGGGLTVHMIATGHFLEWLAYAIEWAVMMPITMGLFFASMFIASAISGGIDFGDLFTAIPKAFFLLAPMNLIGVVLNLYLGVFVNFSFLVFGLIVLFELDVWEAKFMIIIYMFLAIGAKLLIVLLVISMIHGAQMEMDKNSPDDMDGQFDVPAQKAPNLPKSRKELRR
jgi:hypothetical protein